MRILGVNYGHSSAAVLLEDGKIISAIDEEKLSRIKGENAFPLRAISYIFKKHRLGAKDIDYLAVGCENLSEFGYSYRIFSKYFQKKSPINKLQGLFYDGLKRFAPQKMDLTRILEVFFYNSLRELGFAKEKVCLVNHHLAHAASAYYTCPFKDALIVTNDGKGDGLCGASYMGRDGQIVLLNEIPDLHSIGQFYQSVTRFLGFKVNRHEGKITGLAAFGNPQKTFPMMNMVFDYQDGVFRNKFYENEEFKKNPLDYFERYVNRNGFIHINYVRSLHGPLMNFAIAYQLYLNYLQDTMSMFEPKDIAAGIQKLTEEAIVAFVKTKLQNKAVRKICLAGGVFANVKINQRVREVPGVEDVFIQPAMDDAGTALGAALYVWMARRHWPTTWEPMRTVYLGPEYTEREIEESLKRCRLPYRREENFAEVLGRYLYEGRIIGRFNGALEWGPRALGNRSILARPIEKNINDTLNQRLKRTEFMPFAPSVLSDDANDYLEGYSPDQFSARHMTITYNVKPNMIDRIQAAVHVDGTARPQVVFKEDNPSYYGIIKEYKKLSGIGVVINTSFNMHEEPIVNSPEDAIRAFLVGAVDVLSLGPFIVEVKQPL